jgi:NADH-quinone oxidoreductase E subunit
MKRITSERAVENTRLKFSEETEREIQRLLERRETPQSALVGVLHLAQAQFKYISGEVEELIAGRLGLTVAHVHGVMTFYTMFHDKPVGKYLLQFCSTLPCALRGSEELFDHCVKKFGIKNGETTRDGRFTLMKVECLGSCGTAPVVQINDDYYENLDVAALDRLLDSLR